MSFKKKSLTLKFLIAILFSLCFPGCMRNEPPPPLPGIDNEEVMWVVLPYAINLQHDKKLRLENSYVWYGGDGTYIKKMKLNFISQSILELREARDLLVDVVDGLVNSISDDPVLGPMTSAYPLGSDDVEVCIMFESYHGLYVDKAYVHWALLQDGTSYFYAFDLTNEFNIWDMDQECWHFRTEPFYKSRQIVNIQRTAEQWYDEMHPRPQIEFGSERDRPDTKTGRTMGPL